jgi:type II secretory pathway pseudopilin PulG
VLAVLVIVAIAVAVIAVAVPAMSRQRRFNEVDRFHRARAMTTEWARAGITSPVIPSASEPAEIDDKVS